MDIQKEREAFEQLPEINQWIDALKYGEKTGVYIAIDNNKHDGVANWVNGAWFIWQAAKAQAVPENKKFNLDEFLGMEQKLDSKDGVITADLDRFIVYAEMVLEKAKATREPK